jgi:hypothetical protein
MRTYTGVIQTWQRVIISDILVLAFVYLIPTIAHLIPFPLYFFDPMRVAILAGYFLSRNQNNAFILALTVPLFSMIMSGHPFFYKVLLISVELTVNLWFFVFLVNRTKWFVPLSLFVSILASKVIYYILKYLFISFSLIHGKLISTDLLVQLFTVIVITVVFSLFIRLKR